MVEIIDIVMVTIDMKRGVTMLEFIIRVSVIIVFVVTVVISLAFISM